MRANKRAAICGYDGFKSLTVHIQLPTRTFLQPAGSHDSGGRVAAAAIWGRNRQLLAVAKSYAIRRERACVAEKTLEGSAIMTTINRIDVTG